MPAPVPRATGWRTSLAGGGGGTKGPGCGGYVHSASHALEPPRQAEASNVARNSAIGVQQLRHGIRRCGLCLRS